LTFACAVFAVADNISSIEQEEKIKKYSKTTSLVSHTI